MQYQEASMHVEKWKAKFIVTGSSLACILFVDGRSILRQLISLNPAPTTSSSIFTSLLDKFILLSFRLGYLWFSLNKIPNLWGHVHYFKRALKFHLILSNSATFLSQMSIWNEIKLTSYLLVFFIIMLLIPK